MYQQTPKSWARYESLYFICLVLTVSVQDKWLCPLSGKKFKGPDFVKKHILQKHLEKVDEVKKEVNYFNNYLKV